MFTPGHLAVIRDAALEPTVQRIFVNAAIKKALCREAKGDRHWLSKVRPMYGHDYHFHIRIKCPPGAGECESQPDPAEGEGCSTGDLAYWFKDSVLHPKPPQVPPKPKPPMTMASLPPACKAVLDGTGREAIASCEGLSSLRTKCAIYRPSQRRKRAPEQGRWSRILIESRSQQRAACPCAPGIVRTAMRISARNQIKGTVVEVKKGATTSHVRVDIGNGQIITSSITNEAVDDLGIKAGGKATVVVKASDVMIAVD